MPKLTARLLILFILPIMLLLAVRSVSLANEPPTASLLPVEPDVKVGQMISLYEGKYTLSQLEYDSNLVGVLADSAAVVYGDSEAVGVKLVVYSGETTVAVTTQTGNIAAGDFLVGSKTPGVAMKAIKAGNVIGQALESFSAPDRATTGTVRVLVNIHFYPGDPRLMSQSFFSQLGMSVLSLLDVSKLGALEQPSKAFKAVLAVLVVVLSLAFAFMNFGKTAQSGVEAAGRNPLAGRLITVSIILNVGLAILTCGLGLVLEYLLLVL